jgi:hypothetical protein
LRLTFNHPGATIRRGSFVIVMPVILTPFQNVAVHVAEAKGIGYVELIYRGRSFAVFAFGSVCIGVVAVVVGDFGGEGLAEMKGCGSACSAGVFPFGFGGEAVGATCLAGDAGTKFHGVVPTYLLNRSVVTFES